MRDESEQVVVYQTPELYKIKANNAYLVWQASVVENEDRTATLLLFNGQEGGKIKCSTRRYEHGKNVGKRNATTAVQQAINEAKSRLNKAHDNGYRENKADCTALPVRPMLAQSYQAHQHKVKDDTIYIVQPKLNGVRCTVQRHGDTLVFLSRTCKEYDVLQRHKQLCQELLEVMPEGAVWDGEIYKHGWPLEDIVSAVKAFSPETKKLEYWVYDVVDSDLQFERVAKYRALLADKKVHKVVSCPVDYVKGNANIKSLQDKYLQQGYEGLMLRSYSGKYRQGFRSFDLLKYKNFTDKEYKIVGATHSVNGEIIFMCRFNGEPFNVVPAWNSKKRKEAWLNSDSYFGKLLTVRASDFSKRNVPIGCPVGLCVRDYE